MYCSLQYFDAQFERSTNLIDQLMVLSKGTNSSVRRSTSPVSRRASASSARSSLDSRCCRSAVSSSSCASRSVAAAAAAVARSACVSATRIGSSRHSAGRRVLPLSTAIAIGASPTQTQTLLSSTATRNRRAFGPLRRSRRRVGIVLRAVECARELYLSLRTRVVGARAASGWVQLKQEEVEALRTRSHLHGDPASVLCP